MLYYSKSRMIFTVSRVNSFKLSYVLMVFVSNEEPEIMVWKFGEFFNILD